MGLFPTTLGTFSTMMVVEIYITLMLLALTCCAAFVPAISVSRQPTTGRSSYSRLLAAAGETLSSQQEHAREVFDKFDKDNQGTITSDELGNMLRDLDIEATEEEAHALFRYLDEDENGEIEFEEFLPWYSDAVDAAKEVATSFQSLLIGRRTVEQFDQTPVSETVLRRAIQCAIAAPNRSMSEPWRFIKIGPKTVAKFAELNAKIRKNMETDEGASSVLDWTTIPGWCVVTTKLTPGNVEVEMEDFKSTSCAIQNFMLSMWSEGVGTKWTSGPVQKTQEFADLCGVDTSKEKVVGCIWYGFAQGGTKYADPRRRKKTVDDVLSSLP